MHSIIYTSLKLQLKFVKTTLSVSSNSYISDISEKIKKMYKPIVLIISIFVSANCCKKNEFKYQKKCLTCK